MSSKRVSVTIGKNKYECLYVKVVGEDANDLRLTSTNNDGEIEFKLGETSIKNDPDFEYKPLLKLLPNDGSMTKLAANHFISDPFVLIRLWKKKLDNRILSLQIDPRTKSIIEKNVQVIDIVKLMDATVEISKSKQESYQPASSKNNQGTSTGASTSIDANISGIKTTIQYLTNFFKQQYPQFKVQMESNDSATTLLQALAKGVKVLLEDVKKSKDQPYNVSSIGDINTDNSQKQQRYEELVRKHEEDTQTINRLTEDLHKQGADYKKLEQEHESLLENQLKTEDNIARLNRELEVAKKLSIDVKGETLQAMEALINDLEKGQYLFDCKKAITVDDSYLITLAQQIEQKISSIQFDSLTNLRKTLKDLLREELKDPSGLFNKIGRYVAYAHLSFMIEGREEGMKLVPSRVTSIYNKAINILIPLGFQLIIPQLFVETLSDGDYEDVTGQEGAVSELASMCPLLNEHKERIDRKQRMQVIVDISQIGFIEDGIVVEKTKVLI